MSRAPNRVSTDPRPFVQADGSPLPARLRIAAWITLATAVGLLAVVLTIRSALQADLERDANAAVEQEVEEFRTFADEGRDPTTGEPFASARPLLELYLQRQFPAPDEVLAGWDPTVADSQGPEQAALLQDGPDTFGFADEPEVLGRLAADEASSGTDQVAGQTFRWGRAVVEDESGAPVAVFVVADFLDPRQQEAAATVRLIVLVCLGGLLLTAVFAFAVAGAILAPVRAVRRAAAGITRTDLSRRIEVRGRDDVAALASTFNAMLDRLERSFRAQHHFVRIADRDIREPLDVVALARNADSHHRTSATTAGEVLRFGVSGEEDHVELWVEDDGPGLEDDRAQHVLDRYTDLGSDGDPGEGGLGLAVVRAVADAHQGSAWVETAPGQGARFGVRLPRRPPADLDHALPAEV